METEEEHCRVFSVCRPDSRFQFEYYVAKFATSHNVDFTNCPGGAKIERENNLKEFKSAYDIDTMPKSGAGSEYGREQREEARRKKYGIRSRNYNPNDQPFILKLGTSKQQRRLKGTKNGGVSKNTNYVAFTLSGGSKFISHPVGDWYDFTPMPKYKALNAEEAEEQFSKRDKTYNHFAIMCNKKYNKDKDDDEQEKEAKPGKGGKKNKQLLLTEFELMSGSEEEDSEREEEREDDEEDKKKKKKKRNTKEEKEEEAPEEAQEENDDADEGQELDYLSMSSEDEDMYDNDARDEKDIYKDVGVAEEEGLKTLGSDEEEEEEEDEDKKDDEDNDKGKSRADSELDSGSDSDIETNSLFDMPSGKSSSTNKSPILNEDWKTDVAADKKRKSDSPESTNKKQKSDDSINNKSEASIEDIVKKCLLRKPITITDLVKKLSSKPSLINPHSKKEMQHTIVTVMKKLNPLRKSINGLMYFFLQTKA